MPHSKWKSPSPITGRPHKHPVVPCRATAMPYVSVNGGVSSVANRFFWHEQEMPSTHNTIKYNTYNAHRFRGIRIEPCPLKPNENAFTQTSINIFKHATAIGQPGLPPNNHVHQRSFKRLPHIMCHSSCTADTQIQSYTKFNFHYAAIGQVSLNFSSKKRYNNLAKRDLSAPSPPII